MSNPTTLYVGPIRDRRKSRRILTMKNGMWTMLALLVAFTVVSAASEFRKPKPGEFGRLYSHRPLGSAVQTAVEPPVVAEASVREETYADPMSLDTINRQVVLGTDSVGTPQQQRDAWLRSQESQATTIAGGSGALGLAAQPTQHHGRARFAITGGAGGVTVTPGH